MARVEHRTQMHAAGTPRGRSEAVDGLRRALGERVLLLDGGMGSLLIAAGLERGEPAEGWNLEHPERVVAAHRGYVDAGCDVVHTNTFGATPVKLAASGLAGRCREVNAAAVELARRAAGRGVFVAGDVGPTGVFLPPVGDASEKLYRQAFGEQVEALVAAGVDLIAIETMYDVREALAAAEVALATGLPVFASMTFEAKRRGTFTMMGDPLVPSLRALAAAGVDAVGLNCSVGSGAMLAMVREAAGSVDRPLVAQPNAGRPRATADGVAYDADPETFARDLAAMVEAGARVVGGCCGTDPDFLRAARAALDVRSAAR